MDRCEKNELANKFQAGKMSWKILAELGRANFSADVGQGEGLSQQQWDGYRQCILKLRQYLLRRTIPSFDTGEIDQQILSLAEYLTDATKLHDEKQVEHCIKGLLYGIVRARKAIGARDKERADRVVEMRTYRTMLYCDIAHLADVQRKFQKTRARQQAREDALKEQIDEQTERIMQIQNSSPHLIRELEEFSKGEEAKRLSSAAAELDFQRALYIDLSKERDEVATEKYLTSMRYAECRKISMRFESMLIQSEDLMNVDSIAEFLALHHETIWICSYLDRQLEKYSKEFNKENQ